MKLRFAAVFTAGAVLSTLAAFATARHNKTTLHKAVHEGARSAAREVQTRLLTYQYGIRGARGAVVTAGEEGISRAQFHRYSRTRDLAVEFRGARGFGFIRRVARIDEDGFVSHARAEGPRDFAIHELGSHVGDRFVIQYIEPLEHNREALGLDVASEWHRRDAALRAMHSGQAELSAPITLVQAPHNVNQSFLLFMPIYRQDPKDLAQRESFGFGWVFAALSMNEVLTDLPLLTDEVRLAVRDVTEVERPEAFYRSSFNGLPVVASRVVPLSVYGRRWQLEFGVHPAFVRRLNLHSPWLVGGMGTMLSALIATLVSLLSIGGFRRRQIVAEQARLAALVEGSLDGIVGKSLEGIVTSWNKGAEAIFGFEAVEAIGKRLSELVVPKAKAQEEQSIALRTAKGERVPAFSTRRQRRDGTTVEVSISVAPVRAPDGRVVGSSEMIRDITPLKQAERRVLEANANLEKEVDLRVGELRRVNLLLSNVLASASECRSLPRPRMD